MVAEINEWMWWGLKVEAIKTIPTVLIAGMVAAIAYGQYRVAKAKLNLDLFEKRYEVFDLVWDFLIMEPNPWDQDHADEISKIKGNLQLNIPKARFLFGRDIEEYLIDASKKKSELGILWRRKNSGDLPVDLEPRLVELEHYFIDEVRIGLRHKFDPYLDFSKWKSR